MIFTLYNTVGRGLPNTNGYHSYRHYVHHMGAVSKIKEGLAPLCPEMKRARLLHEAISYDSFTYISHCLPYATFYIFPLCPKISRMIFKLNKSDQFTELKETYQELDDNIT